MTKKHNKLLIITGYSGAGMSSSLKHLEDLGYEVFDNFPVTMVKPLIAEDAEKAIAVGVDTRSRGFSPEAVLDTVKDTDATLVFMTAEDAILQKRFSETRRRHPLAGDRPVSDGIRKEQQWLHSLKDSADYLIDTSQFSTHDLRRTLEGQFTLKGDTGLTITVMSFGFKHGLPREADMVMDLRFLKNPHWVEDLKPQTGLDKPVGDYIETDEAFTPFLENFKTMVLPLLPRYIEEGKSYLTIALGCTGGRHRSVYTTETLSSWIKEQGYNTNVFHRDIDR